MSTCASRQKKYRTINRLKGLFITSGLTSATNSSKDLDSLNDLPPQQFKKELLKKIDSLQTEIVKQQKEREGLIKLKDIYSSNQKFGDSQSAAQALKINDEKITCLNNELKKCQGMLKELEQSLAQHQLQQQQQQQKQQNLDYHINSTSNRNGESGSTLPRDDNKMNHPYHIYQSPSQHSLNSSNNTHSSMPGTPMSYHSQNTAGAGHPATAASLSSNGIASSLNEHTPSILNGNMNGASSANNNGIAYAISPLSQLSEPSNKAPIAYADRNESFDDDDEDDDEDGCYEKPSTAGIKTNGMNSTRTTPITTNKTTIVGNVLTKNNQDALRNTKSTVSKVMATVSSTNGYDYDQVDTIVYDVHNQSQTQHRQQQLQVTENDVVIGTALVMYTFEGTVQNAMSVHENECLSVLERDSGDGWTLVKRISGEKGYVPTEYIRIVWY
jgi:hypothetical protein